MKNLVFDWFFGGLVKKLSKSRALIGKVVDINIPFPNINLKRGLICTI